VISLGQDLYLTAHNTHNSQTSMPLAVFKPTIPAYERPQTHALDGSVTGFVDGCNYQQVTASRLAIFQVIKE
jgi:hypothetical protein